MRKSAVYRRGGGTSSEEEAILDRLKEMQREKKCCCPRGVREKHHSAQSSFELSDIFAEHFPVKSILIVIQKRLDFAHHGWVPLIREEMQIERSSKDLTVFSWD